MVTLKQEKKTMENIIENTTETTNPSTSTQSMESMDVGSVMTLQNIISNIGGTNVPHIVAVMSRNVAVMSGYLDALNNRKVCRTFKDYMKNSYEGFFFTEDDTTDSSFEKHFYGDWKKLEIFIKENSKSVVNVNLTYEKYMQVEEVVNCPDDDTLQDIKDLSGYDFVERVGEGEESDSCYDNEVEVSKPYLSLFGGNDM